MRNWAYIVISFWGICTACNGVTNPQPLPIPLTPPRCEDIFISTKQNTEKSFAAGLPGAANQGEQIAIVIHNTTQDFTFQGPVYADGSFFVEVDWVLGDQLEAWVEQEGRQSESVMLTIPQIHTYALPPTIDSISPVQANQVTVTGTADPGSRVIVGNTSQSLSGSTKANSHGEYSAIIPASPGDRLGVFSLDELTAESSDIVEGDVPP